MIVDVEWENLSMVDSCIYKYFYIYLHHEVECVLCLPAKVLTVEFSLATFTLHTHKQTNPKHAVK